MAFNNSTSLPLLLVMSLAATDLLMPLTGGGVSGAINRVKSYFLVNSMVSNTLTSVLGPLLIGDTRTAAERTAPVKSLMVKRMKNHRFFHNQLRVAKGRLRVGSDLLSARFPHVPKLSSHRLR